MTRAELDTRSDWRELAFVLGHALFTIAAWCAPGSALLWFADRDVVSWPLALWLSIGYMLSAPVLALSSWLLFVHSDVGRQRPWLIRATLGSLVGLAVLVCAYALTVGPPRSNNELLAAGLVAIIYFAQAAVGTLNRYPGHISLELGDGPAVVNYAKNIHAGQEPRENYFIGDYPGGVYGYLDYCRLQPLTTAFFFGALRPNRHSLAISCTLAGTLTGLLFGSSLARVVGDPWATPWLSVGMLALPGIFVFVGTGAHTTQQALPPLVLGTLYLAAPTSSYGIGVAIASVVSLGFCFYVRPEGRVLVAALALYVPSCVAFGFATDATAVMITLFGTLLAATLVWRLAPTIVRRIPRNMLHLSFFHYRYDANDRQFVFVETDWTRINRQFSLANFTGNSDDPYQEIANANIGQEIYEHPIAYLRSLLAEVPKGALLFLMSLFSPERQFHRAPWWLAFVPIVVAIACTIWLPGTLPVFLSGLAFLIVLARTNIGMGVRHVLPVVPVTLLAVGAAVSERFALWDSAHDLVLVCGTLSVALVIFDLMQLARVHTTQLNHAQAVIIDELQGHTSAADRIASSYPQLHACMVGNYCLGTTFFVEHLEEILSAESPDVVVIDNARCGPRNFDEFVLRYGDRIPGYERVAGSKDTAHYIFRRSAGARPAIENMPTSC